MPHWHGYCLLLSAQLRVLLKENPVKKITALILLGLLSFSMTSQAEIVGVDDWFGINDASGGFRQSAVDEDVYYAVSTTGQYTKGNDYEIMAGYRFLSEAEYQSRVATTSGNYVHYNQDGWSGYSFGGINRYYFLFSDTLSTGQTTHAGTWEGSTGSWGSAHRDAAPGQIISNWGGFVVAVDESYVAPSTASISSDVNTAPMLGALALLGLAFAGRRKAK
jgi:hypothetical protein